jgi:hypothetical protein
MLAMALTTTALLSFILRTYEYPQVSPSVVNKWLESASKPEIQKYVSDYRAGYFAIRHELLKFAEVVLGYLLASGLLFITDMIWNKKRAHANTKKVSIE